MQFVADGVGGVRKNSAALIASSLFKMASPARVTLFPFEGSAASNGSLNQRTRMSGFGLIDLMLGTAVSLMMMLFILHAVNQISVGRNVHREGDRLSRGAAALQAMINNLGSSIVSSGSAAGFANAYTPTEAELKAAGYMPKYLSTTLPFGGVMQFTVQRGPNNDLLGLACDSQSVTMSGKIAPDVAAKIVKATHGAGVMTSQSNPTVMNGPGMLNVASPISGPAVVCAWAYLPNPN
ncbi:hypothetical protein LPN04_31420 [Rugamonas sp. A1-17]|nr:hypothetical protein [Rugamonas sp. A1-17]